MRVNGTLARQDRVEVDLPDHAPPREVAHGALALPLTVIFEDEHLAVLDKPAGLVVHPAPGHWEDTLVNALLARGTALAGGVAGRPGIVHRLDRDTSGLLIIAKTDLAHRRLAAAIAARGVRRAYAALAWGHLPAGQEVSAPIGRHSTDRKRMVVRQDGRAARSDFELVARFEVADLVRAELHSGRTHQIRVHLEHIGHPVVGDPVYGGGGPRRISGASRSLAERLARACSRQALHAAELRFRHPTTGRPLEFRSEWPEDLGNALGTLQGVADHVATPKPLTYLGFFQDPDA